MRKTKEEAAVTRLSLIKAALVVFSTWGYSATTLEDIARQAGLTRGAIYWHFKNKAELYNSLIQEYSSRGATITQNAVLEGGTLVDILRRIFIHLLSALEDDPELCAVTELSLFKTELNQGLLSGRQQQVEAGRMLINGISEAVRHGIESGELRTDLEPIMVARAFMAFQNGAVYLWLLDRQAFSVKASAEAFANIFMDGIKA